MKSVVPQLQDVEKSNDDGIKEESSTARASVPSARRVLRLKAIDGAYIMLNLGCTVTLIPLNKWLFQDPQLRNMQMTFAMWHSACTAIVLYVASLSSFKLFAPIRLPALNVIPLASLFAGSLISSNLSLTYNPIGFYQLIKITSTPCIAILQYIFLSHKISLPTASALSTLCIGVALTINSKTNDGVTIPGAGFAITACACNSLYAVWIAKKMKDFSVSSPALLLNQAPISAILLVCVAPFFDTLPDVEKIPWDKAVAWWLSGGAGALLNLTQFLIIGRMSTLTFNVLSQLKTVLILAYAWTAEERVLTMQDALGVALALGGAIGYSQTSQH